MKCRDMQELLSAYADAELSSAQRDFVEEHLAGCGDCRNALDDFLRTRAQILSLGQVPQLAGFKDEIMAKTTAPAHKDRNRLWRMPVAARVVLSAVLLAALGFGLVSQFNKSPDFWPKVAAVNEEVTACRVMVYERDSVFDAAPDFLAQETSFVAPDTSDTTVYFIYGSERIISSGGQFYVRTPENTHMITPDSRLYLQNVAKPDAAKSLDSMNYYTKLEQLPDEMIDGKLCLHYRATGNNKKYYEYLLKQSDPQSEAHKAFAAYLADDSAWMDEQLDTWISKDDYLVRRQDRSQQYPNSVYFVTHSLLYFYDDVEVMLPLDNTGKTLKGWYLFDEATFKASAALALENTADGTVFHAGVTLANNTLQALSNVRVFGWFYSMKTKTFPAESTTTFKAVMGTGDSRTYAIDWLSYGPIQNLIVKDYQLVEDNSEEAVKQGVHYFVEFTTPDGVNHIQLLNITP